MRNQLKVQSISSHCHKIRCCSVFISGYNHSKISLLSHLNLLAAAEACLDQVRTDMAGHFMFQLCPGMQLISILPSKTCVCTAQVDQPGADEDPELIQHFPLISDSIDTVNWSGNKRMQVDKGSPANTEGDHHRESWFGPSSFTLFQMLSFQRAWNGPCEYVCFKYYSLGVFSLPRQQCGLVKNFN